MKVIVVKSDHSEVPLAEIRTDGRVLDFVVDNTNGKLPALFQNSYQRMQQVISQSSHMQLSETSKATVNLLRYVMDNGDVVEITSDGHTVILNGNLLSQPEKDALLNAFSRGDIKVARKTDVSQAIPVMPANPPQEYKPVKYKMNQTVMEMVEREQKDKKQADSMATREYDPEIDDAHLDEAEDKDWTRDLMRWLKYGDKR